jgi:uncharacterized membrane protein YbhN (UPF0104 family)
VDPGNRLSYATITVVYLTAQTAGSFVPIPSGVGTVETAMTFALITVGVSSAFAAPAVLIFRLLRTYLPAIPGYVTFTQLQRRGIL